MKEETRYSIQELADLSGVTRRSVRFYVQRGLLPSPLGTGRGKHYDAEHLDRIVQIKVWQETGISLDEIYERIHGAPQEKPERVEDVPKQEAWMRVLLDEGLELHVQGHKRAITSEELIELKKAIQGVLQKEKRRDK